MSGGNSARLLPGAHRRASSFNWAAQVDPARGPERWLPGAWTASPASGAGLGQTAAGGRARVLPTYSLGGLRRACAKVLACRPGGCLEATTHHSLPASLEAHPKPVRACRRPQFGGSPMLQLLLGRWRGDAVQHPDRQFSQHERADGLPRTRWRAQRKGPASSVALRCATRASPPAPAARSALTR
jgi:hypothetical protein